MTLGSGQTKNTQIGIFAYFQFDHFQKSKIYENVYIFILKKFIKRFGQYFKKSKKMDIPLYFQKVMLLWKGSIVEIDYGLFRVFGPYFIGKSQSTFKILIFGLWSFIPHPQLRGCSHIMSAKNGGVQTFPTPPPCQPKIRN